MLGLPDRIIGFIRREEDRSYGIRVAGNDMIDFNRALNEGRISPRHVIEVDSIGIKRVVYLRSVRTDLGRLTHIFTILEDNDSEPSFEPFCLDELGPWAVVERMHVETWERRAQLLVLNRKVEELAARVSR